MSDERNYHLMLAGERANISRTITSSFEEAVTVAKVMSRSTDHYNPMTIMVCDDYNVPLTFVHDGDVYERREP